MIKGIDNQRKLVDILRVVTRVDRLKAMLMMSRGRCTVKDMTREIYGDTTHNHNSQMSMALSPMRQLDLIQRVLQEKRFYYELTELGREVFDMIVRFEKHLDANGTKSFPINRNGHQHHGYHGSDRTGQAGDRLPVGNGHDRRRSGQSDDSGIGETNP